MQPLLLTRLRKQPLCSDKVRGDTLAAVEEKLGGLRRRVLMNAFSGQLVPQDPNDEPASALLDRILGTR
ncbi:MAG: hypothetical protein F4138_03545 [Acidimicrobiia bacterium]|nr:hypothetical protein [Acidimicrobiia bacterium]